MATEAATCLCGRPSYFVEGPRGQPEYAVAACDTCIEEEGYAREVVAECEHRPVRRAEYVMCVRCGGMRCRDGTWLHPLRMPRTPHDLEAA